MTRKKTISGTKSTSVSTGTASQAGTAVEPRTVAQEQLKKFEEAVHLFSQRKFTEALELFREAARGPAQAIADKARAYIQVCERRTSSVELKLITAEDHFNYGVERLNARDIEKARLHFDHALALEPNADHVFYTLALCCGVAGDGNGACENLRRAIELEPRNRILARQDPEFGTLLHQFTALRALLVEDSR